MSALSRISNEMNNYINTKGKLKSSTGNSGFLNQWHSLDNDFWLAVFDDVEHIEKTTKYKCKTWTSDNIKRLKNHIELYREEHNNILNPTPKDMVGMHKAYTHFDKLTSVKSVLWKTMMELREFYCRVHDIDLPNDDSSIGKLRSTRDVFGELFEWR